MLSPHQWCGPCRQFTPVLATTYDDQEGDKEVEVVFCSLDHEEKTFESYFKTMPWCAVPFAAAKQRQALTSKMGVNGIPRVIVLNAADGVVVDYDARGAVVAKRALKGVFTSTPAPPPPPTNYPRLFVKLGAIVACVFFPAQITAYLGVHSDVAVLVLRLLGLVIISGYLG